MTDTKAITAGQIRSLRTGLSGVAGKDSAAHLYIVAKLLERPLDKLGDLRRHEWKRLRDTIYPNWRGDDWAVSDTFRMRCADLFDEYREGVLGQRRLF